MKRNLTGIVLGTIGGTIFATLMALVFFEFSFSFVVTGFLGALICSTISDFINNPWPKHQQPTKRVEKKPIEVDSNQIYFVDDKNKINYELIGYLNAKRWHRPFTQEQRNHLAKVFPNETEFK